MFTSSDIHKLLLQQIGDSTEVSDYRNDSVVIGDSVILKNQKSLTAIETIPPNTIIFSYKNKVTPVRSKYSVQVSESVHLEPGEYGKFANHSCKPNSYMWTALRESGSKAHVVLVSLYEIKKGEEISFDYASTEMELTPSISGTPCLCREFGCRLYMKGFSDLTDNERAKLLETHTLSGYLKEKHLVF